MPRGIFFAFAREPDLLAIGSRMTVARLILSHCWLQESRPQNWGEGRQLDRPDACAGSSAPVQEVFSHGIAALQGWKRRRFGDACTPNISGDVGPYRQGSQARAFVVKFTASGRECVTRTV